jgi:TrmH family RNA methyltransferase
MPPAEEIITSIKHPAVAEARRRVARSGGQAPQAFLADGRKLVTQALDAGAPIEAVFFLEPADPPELRALLQRARDAGLGCHVARRGVFFRILDLGYETSVGVLAVVRRPAPAGRLADLLAAGAAAEFCALVGERIQDPRNVGVLVRTADAFGLAAAVFIADSADPWCRPAVRSTTGSVFRVPIRLPADLPGALADLKTAGVRIIGSSAGAPGASWQADLAGPCALVVGNETQGLTDELAAVCDEIVTIPMSGGAHSFNVTVAAGILAYERARQMAQGGLRS